MKSLFTCMLISASIYMPFKNGVAQTCNVTAGSNGVSTALPSAITIDGNMADWTPYLNDPDNNSYDNTGGLDLDAPISDNGRDLVRFAFTESANNLYIYLQREGSSSNPVDIVFYVDLNNNDEMEFMEPVFHIDWKGSNGNVSISVKNYSPSLLNILLNTLSLNLDGKKLMGTLNHRGNQGPGSSSGKGSADGKSVEVMIPFTQITRLNILGNVVDQLSFGEDFKFHVSTINGNISSIPGANSINDNFGGCMRAPAMILPVDLLSFSATNAGNSKVNLSWITAAEMNASHFVVERSFDGKTWTDAGTVYATGNSSDEIKYGFIDNLGSPGKTVAYYRLRQVDTEGQTSYSATRTIRLSEQSENAIKLLVYPNPMKAELNVTIPNNWQSKTVVYEIYSDNGQLAARMQTSNSSQTETLNLINLKPGIFFMRANCQGEIIQQKIIKQ